MCQPLELELCCAANLTNTSPHTIKIYNLVYHCTAFLEVVHRQRINQNTPNYTPNNDNTTTPTSNGTTPNPVHGHPSPSSPPQQQQQRQQLHCPVGYYPNGPHRLERIFVTTCAACVRTAHHEANATSDIYRRSYQWEIGLHALQLDERLRRVKLERVMAAVPWGAFVRSLGSAAADELGVVRERWVLSGSGNVDGSSSSNSNSSGMRWVRIPFSTNGGGGECGGVDAGWNRWWSGRFGEEMWKLCDQTGAKVFPDGFWGPCALEGIDMNQARLNFQVLTPVTTPPSTISTPTTPRGSKYCYRASTY